MPAPSATSIIRPGDIRLPIIRTRPSLVDRKSHSSASVDHGTAFDIAGQGIAREASLVLSMRRAAALAPGWGHVWRAAQKKERVGT
ncbi:4-hydroxythreonine-4-phosphate dehydrogenase PdxA [Arthrobacter sp. Ld5]|uniref:4-hydroxythreonine-4-phosphate dehydrogenase PdxA n=1 Tax=Arthrobacter sp. Ld5 TaxID=649152 RepID=UPI003EB83C46